MVYIVVNCAMSPDNTEIVSFDVNRAFDTIEKAKAYILDKLSEYDHVNVDNGRYYGRDDDLYATTIYSIRGIEVL